ncbi:single-stranded DNA-binding protein [Ignavibacteria bacterium]|jgi:single-strand DNA-binding protein|nr:single-stranded DNA-binding protein [Bacteroidota bacterium]MCZ2131700.1 single-stranded DNA-binding protein [Bacteroidota bacterium]
MTRSLNKVMLIGNVGADPEINHTPSGVPVATFRIATTESWKDRDGATQERTDWHSVVAWRWLADVTQKIVHKGTRIFIEGRLQNRTFEDRDGNKRTVTEIIADNMLVLDSRQAQSRDAHHDEPINTAQDNTPPAGPADDIPF